MFVELGGVEDGGWGMSMHGGMRELNANTESMFESGCNPYLLERLADSGGREALLSDKKPP